MTQRFDPNLPQVWPKRLRHGQLDRVAPASAAGSVVAATGDDTRSGNIVLVWNQALLDAVSAERFAPMWTARALAIVHTCMYDAWAACDSTAVGVHWTGSRRQPPEEHTEPNEAEAVSFAAHAALVDLFPSRTQAFDQMLASHGYLSLGPAGVLGLAACDDVLRARHADGANQLGDLAPGAYADYTGYLPVNPPDAISDPNRWQPLMTPAGPQAFLAPHWGLVRPFAIDDLDALRPAPPPLYPHGLYRKEANAVVHASGTLNDRTKMIAEDWADGPGSVTPPFAEYVSGHSTFSAAGAEILRLFSGSDAFVASVTFAPGSSAIEPGVTPAQAITLTWATFSEAADQAGLSRRHGGIHFESGDLAGRGASGSKSW